MKRKNSFSNSKPKKNKRKQQDLNENEKISISSLKSDRTSCMSTLIMSIFIDLVYSILNTSLNF